MNGTIMKSIETKLSIKEKVGYSLAFGRLAVCYF
jgi:hypothetical protein